MASCIDIMFENHQIRIVPQKQDLWFVLADACRVAEIANSRDAASRLDDDEKGVVIADTLGGPQEMLIVSEPGFYKILQTSRKPEAKRLDRFMRHEVMPSLRKHGCYPPPSNLMPPEIAAFSQLFDKKLEPIRADIKEIKGGLKLIVDNTAKGRKDPTTETLRIHAKVIRYHYFCRCPCGECDTVIMDDNGFISGIWNYHHQFNRWDNRPTATIPLARECHERIERNSDVRIHFSANAFVQFQRLLA